MAVKVTLPETLRERRISVLTACLVTVFLLSVRGPNLYNYVMPMQAAVN